MNVIIRIRNNYGNEQAYPINDTAKTFARMLGTTTLTTDALRYIKELGFNIEVEANIPKGWDFIEA